MRKELRIPWRHYSNLIIAVPLSFICYLVLLSRRIIQTDQEYFLGFILVVSTTVFFLWFNLFLTYLRFRWLQVFLNLLTLFVLTILLCYQLLRGAPLDFALIYTNFGELLSEDGFSQVWQVGGSFQFSLIILSIFGLLWLELTQQIFTNFQQPRMKHLAFIVLTAANIFLVWGIPKNPNQIYAFARSAFQYFQDPDEALLSYIDSNQKFPYVNNFNSKHSAEKAPKHIFVLMMESFSSTWVDQLAGNGKEVTPFFNSLKKKGIYFDTFYSNSMQTERGHSAMICSIIPSYRAKIMTSYIDNHFRCLPEILNEAGYTSIYIQAHQGLKFDNTGNFMQRIGFQNVLSMDEKFVKPDEKGLVWGWGLQDDIFYQKYFKYLDDLHAMDSKAKFFSVLATISNHQGFDDMPNDQKFLYSEPQSFTQAFQNSIHLADVYLKTFFAELNARGYLEDSLILILGDHGFPTGVRQNLSNEISFYDELFRVPLLMLWNGKIQPTQISNVAFSQIDIAPTILDLAGISTLSQFIGKPLPQTQQEANVSAVPVPILQPYDGVYLGSVLYPWKYVKSLSSGDEMLFNLSVDPLESKNLIHSKDALSHIPVLKETVKKIYLNQRLLTEDRIFTKGDQ